VPGLTAADASLNASLNASVNASVHAAPAAVAAAGDRPTEFASAEELAR